MTSPPATAARSSWSSCWKPSWKKLRRLPSASEQPSPSWSSAIAKRAYKSRSASVAPSTATLTKASCAYSNAPISACMPRKTRGVTRSSTDVDDVGCLRSLQPPDDVGVGGDQVGEKLRMHAGSHNLE